MKKSMMLFAILVSNSIFAQEINEATLRNDLNIIIKDATTGFQTSKAGFEQESWSGKYYYSNTSIFKSNTSNIVYRERKVMKYTDDMPEAFYFSQSFKNETAEGTFITENIERIFDEFAVTMNLKKKNGKIVSKDKKAIKNILYLDQQKRTVLEIYSNSNYKDTQISIYSDLRPGGLPNYLGCLVIYNIQAEKVVGVSINYIYGKSLASAESLYYILKPKLENQYTHYDKYEWLSGQNQSQVEGHIAPFGNIQKLSRKITPEGNPLSN